VQNCSTCVNYSQDVNFLLAYPNCSVVSGRITLGVIDELYYELAK